MVVISVATVLIRGGAYCRQKEGSAMLVKQVMQSGVPTMRPDAATERAIKKVYNADVGCAVVVDDVPTGIVTKSDLLVAAYKADTDLEEIPVGRVMSHPMVTIGPNTPVQTAVRQMKRNDVKHLPVVEDYELVGVITPTNVVGQFEELMGQARRRES